MSWYKTAIMAEEDKEQWMKDIDDIVRREDEKKKYTDNKGNTIFNFGGVIKYPQGYSLVNFMIGGKKWEYVVGNDIGDKIQQDMSSIKFKNKNLSNEEISRIVYGRYIPKNKRSEIQIDDKGNRIGSTYKEF